MLIAGRYILRRVLRLAALSAVREILTATALLIAFGMAFLLEAAGLSMALGAFIAGGKLSFVGWNQERPILFSPNRTLEM